jgi:fibronectin-binding autotransporter adhesin
LVTKGIAMRHRRLISCLAVSFCAVWVLATTARATVIPFDLTGAMTLTQGGGYNNQLSLSLSQSGFSGSGNTTASGWYSLELLGGFDTSAGAATVTGVNFIKQSGPGNITCSNFGVHISVIFWHEDVTFTGLRGDLATNGGAVGVTGVSFPLSSTELWLNGGTATVVGNIPGVGNSTVDLGTSPASGSTTGNGSISLTSVGVSANLATFTATVITPINVSATIDAASATTSGSLRAIGTFQQRLAATYAWTNGSGSWTTVGNWDLGNFAPASGDSVLMTNGGAISLGGATQSVVNVGAAGNGVVGTLQNGSLAFTGDMYVKSGTINVDLSNSGGAGRLWIGGDSGATVYLGGNNTVTFSDTHSTIIGHGTTGAAGTVKLLSNTALGPSSQQTQLFAGMLDLNGQAGVTVGSLVLESGASSTLINGNTSAVASYGNTVDLNGGVPNIGGAGNLTLGGTLQNGGFVKIGPGTLTLTGTNTYTGSTVVNAGKLVVNGSIAASSGVSVVGGASLGGSGTVPAISGAGLVSVGNSPGILTTSGVNPSGGLDFAMEFTRTGSPAYGSPTASGNDVLRLTGAFSSSLTSANAVNVYLDVAGIATNQQFRGGFYLNASGDFANSVKGGTYSYYVLGDGHGGNPFNGAYYYTLAEYDTAHALNLYAVLSTMAETANFGDGNVSGRVMQVTLVPEPGTIAMLLVLAASLAGYGCLKRRG